MIASKYDVAVHAIDPLRIGEMPVVGNLIDYKQGDDHADRHSDRESEDIDQGVKLMFFEVSQRDEEMVF